MVDLPGGEEVGHLGDEPRDVFGVHGPSISFRGGTLHELFENKPSGKVLVDHDREAGIEGLLTGLGQGEVFPVPGVVEGSDRCAECQNGLLIGLVVPGASTGRRPVVREDVVEDSRDVDAEHLGGGIGVETPHIDGSGPEGSAEVDVHECSISYPEGPLHELF